jgi:hypothetical protein
LGSCRIREYPFDKAITMDTVQKLSFIQEYTGVMEWDKAIVHILQRCLQPAPFRCDNFVEILTALCEGERDPFAVTEASASPDGGVLYSVYLEFLDCFNKLIREIDTDCLDDSDSFDKGIAWLMKVRKRKQDGHCN